MINKVFVKRGLAFALLVPFSLFGENLSQLLELSKNNKMIESSKYSLESVKDEYESVKKGYLPYLSVGGKYQLTNKESSSVPDNMNSIYGNLRYVLYDGGKKYDTYDSYESSIKSASESLESSQNSVALQVVTYYYTYLSYISQKEATEKEIEQLLAQQNRLEKFLEVGSTTLDEVQKIISSVQAAKVTLNEIELNIQTILHNLEYTVGQSVSISSGSKVDNYLSKEMSLRNDIKALEFDLQTLLSTAKSQKSSLLPTIYLDDTFTRYDLNYDTALYSANSNEYEQNVVSLNLSWKIFDFGSTSSAYESAYKKYLALKSQYEYEKKKASVDLKLAYKSYDIGLQKIESAKAALNASNIAYELIKSKYQNGLVDNVSFLTALSEKYSAQSAVETALNDLEIKKANIIYYSGKKLEEFIK